MTKEDMKEMQKIPIGAVIIFFLIVFGAGGYILKTSNNQPIVVPQPSVSPTNSIPTNDQVYQCTTDSDCVSIRADSCGCQAGGKQTAINKNYVEYWNGKFSQKGIVCAQVYLCNSETPKCVNNSCQLVQ